MKEDNLISSTSTIQKKTLSTVLIVDDNALNRKILRKILSDEYHILEASNGQDALKIVKESINFLAAMVLDLAMPGMNGYEVLDNIAKDPLMAELPVLIATGDDSTKTEEQCLLNGAWDYVIKPYVPSILKIRLRNIIGRSQMELAQKVKRLAEQDGLTGLYNRQFFFVQTAAQLKSQLTVPFVFVRIDIDRFRLFNTFFGSDKGDQLLIFFSTLLTKHLSQVPYCTYGRINSDVFAFCEPYDKDLLNRQMLALKNELAETYTTYHIDLSFGIYVIESHNQDMETIYSYSTEATQLCKMDNTVYYAFYNAQMHETEAKRQKLTNDMENALRNEEYVIYLQPKYALDTNTPCGAEALVRWQHPINGLMLPGEFIPVFEQNGFIQQLDHYMWEHTCMLLHKWTEAGYDPFPISVNVSRVSLYNPSVVDDIDNLVKKYHLPPHLLNLEITESAYMSNPTLMKKVLAELRKRGFVLMMDDFGSGYSSLNTLKDIDMDILKVDMKFLPTGSDNVKSEKILASVTRMAGWLGMPVVVEGVETNSQKEFLNSIGCGYVQGYYFSRPITVEEYEKLAFYPQDGQSHPVLALTDNSDLDTLWSSTSSVATLFNGFSFPFAILSYSNNEIEYLRMNDAFIRAFDSDRTLHQLSHEELSKLLLSANETVTSHQDSECECMFILKDGISKWYRIKLHYIQRINKSHLLSATYSDNSNEHKLEQELHRIFTSVDQGHVTTQSMLIADDSELSRDMLTSMFQQDYRIITAVNGKEALSVLQEQTDSISIILLDMIMPVMDGLTFLTYKNSMPKAANIPVVIISSDTAESTQLNMLQNGVNDYITKPFTPEVVVRRIRNVLDYNSRFRTLVTEYRNTGLFTTPAASQGDYSVYSIDQIRHEIDFMNSIFDYVRIVDPTSTAVLHIEDDGTLTNSPYTCFNLWNKTSRCENCTSQCAITNHCMMTKYEFIENNIFYVISKPIYIYQKPDSASKDSQKLYCVLEIASRVSDHLLKRQIEHQSIREMLEETQRKIYEDPLTTAYNRRYFDEMLLLHNSSNEVATHITLILMDMHHFKQINDLFGHQAGDQVLIETARVLQGQVRKQDSVIRYGGDEFIIILTNCKPDQIEPTIGRLKRAINTIHYGPNQTMSANAEFGYGFDENFNAAPQSLELLFHKADDMLYKEKGKDKK